MPRNGSGTYSLPAGNPVVTGTTISSTVQNNTMSDVATALTASIAKDGQTTPTANLPMGGFKLTGLGAATAATDAAQLQQIQNADTTYLTSVSGTNTITATAGLAPTYAVGQLFMGIAAATNTGATTLNISSVGAGAVQLNGAALAGGEIVIGMPFIVLVSAATPVFQLLYPRWGITQNSQSAAYTTVLADAGKHILHPAADTNNRTFTIDSNANVAYPIGTAITFVNMVNTVTIAITSDTMTLMGAGSTGSRTLAANGIATAIKIASTSWVISGTNLT